MKKDDLQIQKSQIRSFDRKLDQLREAAISFPRPNTGWIRFIRSLLAMTTTQLAKKLGIAQASLTNLEQNEVEDKITLASLRKAADALNCDLVYALCPREPIGDQIKNQATIAARNIINASEKHMSLEAQETSRSSQQQAIDELADELASELKSTIWNHE